MSKIITISRKGCVVKANSYMPNKAYRGFVDEATALKGKIVLGEKGIPMATFNSVENAEKFATTWRANYNANRKVSVEPTVAPTVKPKASKGKTEELTTVLNGVKYKLVPMTEEAPSSTKKTTKATAPKKSTTSSKKAPRKTKGNAFDYSVIKGKTVADKNKALHKELVKMGFKDSRTPEYMSVWNARPWAK